MFKRIFVLSVIVLSISLFHGCNKDDGGTTPQPTTPSIGVLELNPNAIFANMANQVVVKLIVPADVQLQDSTVEVFRVGSDGKVTGNSIGKLYDNGKLTNGDEIIGDNVFTGLLNFNETSTGTMNLRATATFRGKTDQGESAVFALTILAQLAPQDMKNMLTTQNSAVDQFNTYLAGNVNNVSSAMTQLTTWLQSQTTVQSVTNNGGTAIEVQYKSGIMGGIVIAVENTSDEVELRGGADEPKRNNRQIPLKFQTRGITNTPPVINSLKKAWALDPTIIGNRNVLIYAPFENAFAPSNEGDKIKAILNNSEFEFSIDHYRNADATVAVLYNLTNYGYVVLATHGTGGTTFLTGEQADTNSNIWKTKYKALVAAQKLAVFKNVVIGKNGAEKIRQDVYGVRHTFISDLAGTFPNSVILNNSCESNKTASLSAAFTGKGAKTYYGYSKIVSSKFCVINADTLTKRLAKDLKTTGDAFMPGNDPYSANNAAFQMVGANNVHYPDELINGDFEFGKIDGWTRAGDGRVISSLGTQGPTGGSYMGIISTGLGYTTATGSIFQTFTVNQNQSTLTVKWNFLSEEFLEYIGSSYQDYFRITIKDKDGNVTTLYSKTVDGIASQFGATKTSAGQLISVSPGIVFDQAGVYMTGWQTSTYDISAFKGKRITLIFAAGDVGDSIYDTAILLDDIGVQ
ncbi:MAG: choice-of-anchor L domain-containing protein [Ignavibacteriaceae bacterium]